MDIGKGEKAALIGATMSLVVGMMVFAVQAAEESRQRAALGRGEGTPTPAPVVSPEEEDITDDEAIRRWLRGEREPQNFVDDEPEEDPGFGGPAPTPDFRSPRATPGPVSDDPSVNPAATGTPPRNGRYEYRSEDDPDESYTVRMESVGGGRYRERQEREDAQGFEQYGEMVWSEQSKLFDKQVTRFGGDDFTCDWQPDLLMYSFPLSRGATWEAKGSCTMSNPFGSTTITIDSSSEVVGANRMQVGGQSADVWVIESDGTVTFTDSDGDSFSFDIFGRDHFSPAHGLTVKSEGDNEFGESGTFVLQNLDPR